MNDKSSISPTQSHIERYLYMALAQPNALYVFLVTALPVCLINYLFNIYTHLLYYYVVLNNIKKQNNWFTHIFSTYYTIEWPTDLD